MTAKEKAVELITKYLSVEYGVIQEYIPVPMSFAKQCALIAVNEILNLEPPELSYMEPFSKSWWQEVKLEIEKHQI